MCASLGASIYDLSFRHMYIHTYIHTYIKHTYIHTYIHTYRVDDFEYTEELSDFDSLDVALVHGWVLDHYDAITVRRYVCDVCDDCT